MEGEGEESSSSRNGNLRGSRRNVRAVDPRQRDAPHVAEAVVRGGRRHDGRQLHQDEGARGLYHEGANQHQLGMCNEGGGILKCAALRESLRESLSPYDAMAL